MEEFFRGLLNILEYAVEHDGIVAMLGIAVTVLIFRKEVVNNYYSLEKENFNEVFRPAYKEIPKKIKQLENSPQEMWNDCFEELLNEFAKMLDGANYFRYTMPYLYNLLETYIGEIEDLSRHDNWRLYRCSERQLQLVTRKARKIIRAIDNASKGKVWGTKLRCTKYVRKMKALFISWFVDRPYDRIASQIRKSLCCEAIEFKGKEGENYSIDSSNSLDYVQTQICPKSEATDIKVIPIQMTGAIRFGYMWNFRIGKSIGKIVLKTPKDRSVKIRTVKRDVKIELADKWPHKVVVIWRKKGDDNHLFYDVIKIRHT